MSDSNPKNPMKGLLPFEESDASKYYIDAKQVEAFARQLERSHFVVLRGSTGVGKTSFLNAVFSEAYKKIRPDHDRWVSVYVRPGLKPLKSTAYALSVVHFSQTSVGPDFALQAEELLESSANGLAELFEKHDILPGVKLLLVIDPMDDLFLLSDILPSSAVSPEQRIMQFINLLAVFEQQCKDIPVYVVLSFANNAPEKVGSYPKFLDLMEKNKFVFKGPQIEELPQILINIIPKEVQGDKNFESFVDLILSDARAEMAHSPEWLLHLQHALKRTLDLWFAKNGDIIAYYQQVGGIKSSIVQHADEIYVLHESRATPKHKRIYELFLRSMMDGHGTFIPLQYGHILELATRYYKEDKEDIERDLIRPFVRDLGPQGLGFLEIIRSVEEADRAQVLKDKDLIADNDILHVKNEYLADQWPLLNTFKHAKTKLMNEYEWYARVALEKSNGKDYPTTLQPYALADPHRDKSKDPEEFHVIDELLLINEVWVQNNFGSVRPDQASFEKTRTYIIQGIKYWQIKDQEEKAALLKIERRKTLMSKLLWSGLLLSLFIYAFFQEIYKLDNRMKGQLDCIYYENKRMISFIDSVHIGSLEAFQDKDSLAKLRLRANTKVWRDALRRFSNNMDQPHDSLYQEGILRFAFHYFSWRETCDRIILEGNGIHKSVLEGAIKDDDFLRSYKSVVEIKAPGDCDDVPGDALYYINCKECEACTVCQ